MLIPSARASTRRLIGSRACVAGVLLLAGCASVDPAASYDRAGEHVRNATGEGSLYRPGDEHVAESKMAECLAEGLTIEEIADRVSCGTRTVHRRLDLVRRVWSDYFDELQTN